ncbi:FKBP-type peptidyl-prolyl cis-trans isomerase [Myxococcaceae bacterium GXIMD 01537]
MLRAWLACSLLLLSACDGDSASGDPQKVTFAPALGVDLNAMTRSSTGLYLQDLKEGTGTVAQSGSEVGAHYTGWLPDGSQFDSSAGKRPIFFTLGAGRVIAGWDEGLVGMKVGGKRRLVIPSELGYGERGSPPVIPANSVLVFDVELVSVD